MIMRKNELPPGPAFRKQNGSWTFYAYLNGVQQESGNYINENIARQHAEEALETWVYYRRSGLYRGARADLARSRG